MQWTPELKAQVIEKYLAQNPTGETSTEIIKEIAEELEASPNGVRMVLVQSGDYVKKDAGAGATTTTKAGAKTAEGGTKRVSKESSITALKEAIKAKGAEVDDEILDKLTGKAAIYFTKVLST
jgi:transposase-like protein